MPTPKKHRGLSSLTKNALIEQLAQRDALLMERDNQIQDCTDQLLRLQALESAAEGHDEKVQQLTNLYETALADLAIAQETLETMRAENAELLNMASENSIQQAFDDFKQEAGKREAKLNTQIATLEEQVTLAKEGQRDAEAKMASMKTELGDAKKATKALEAARKKNNTQQKKLKTQRTRISLLEREKSELENELATLQEATNAPAPVTIPTTAKRFQLYLYAEEGQLRGYIENALSEKHRAFQGMTLSAVKSFLSEHLPDGLDKTEWVEPAPNEAPASPKPIDSEVTASPETVEEVEESEPKPNINWNEVGRPRIDGLHLKKGGIAHKGSIPPDTTFTAALDLDLAQLNALKRPKLPVKIKVFARDLSGTDLHRQLADETQELAWGEVIHPVVEAANGLPGGYYRLETTVSISLGPDLPVPLSAYASETILVR